MQTLLTQICTKRLGILRKKEGMPYDAFKLHWLEVHAALCVKLPGMRRYAVNWAVRPAGWAWRCRSRSAWLRWHCSAAGRRCC